MRATAAYFVGAGTMVAALAIGLGGGLIAGNIMNPTSPKQGPDTAKLERRAEPPVATSERSERVQYVAGSQAFGAVIAPPARAETQTATANTEAQSPQPAQTAEQQASGEPASAPENAYAKAKDSDLKRAASDRRRAERRQQWAERRHYETRAPRDRTDWDDVARNVREDSKSREFASGPRYGAPQIRLFGPDDD